MRDHLNDMLKFSRLLHCFQKVVRTVRTNGEDRFENDVEHSYQLAMLAWYIIDSRKLPLDTGLVLKYALVHDLVEAYAGDTYAYTEDTAHRESKAAREEAARRRIKEEFPEAEEIHGLMEAYESRSDAESRFVYALDKVHPMLNIYLNSGREFRENKVTMDMVVGYKRDKVREHPEIEAYFDELMVVFYEEEENLFGSKK